MREKGERKVCVCEKEPWSDEVLDKDIWEELWSANLRTAHWRRWCEALCERLIETNIAMIDTCVGCPKSKVARARLRRSWTAKLLCGTTHTSRIFSLGCHSRDGCVVFVLEHSAPCPFSSLYGK